MIQYKTKTQEKNISPQLKMSKTQQGSQKVMNQAK